MSTSCGSALAPAPNVPNPRNAGRKKSNPVWEFFTDLRQHGLAGVRCRFCHWVTNDRSPTTMKFHLKRKHDTGPGGLWAICEEKINQQPPVNYAPRKKAVQSPCERSAQQARMPWSDGMQHSQLLANMLGIAAHNMVSGLGQEDFFSQLMQQAAGLNANEEKPMPMEDTPVFNPVEAMAMFFPKIEMPCAKSDEKRIDVDDSHGSGSEEREEEDSPAREDTATRSSSGDDFSLADGASIASLLQIAAESDLTFTFNSRQNTVYCFSSNKKPDHQVQFTDEGEDIRVVQKVGEKEVSSEAWRKSDWQQFCWAVRGTCTHFLK